MAEYISCRDCSSPDCKGCNLKNLEMMLKSGKFDCIMNGNRCILVHSEITPVQHGRWIDKNSPYDVNIHVCSVCKEQVSILGNKLRYCPNCGAKMD